VQSHAELDDDSEQVNYGSKGSVSVSDKRQKDAIVQIVKQRSNVTGAGRLAIPASQKFTSLQILVTGYAAITPEDVKGMFVINEIPAAVTELFNGGVYPDSGDTGDWPVQIAPLNEVIDTIDMSVKDPETYITSIDYSPVYGGSGVETALNFMFI